MLDPYSAIFTTKNREKDTLGYMNTTYIDKRVLAFHHSVTVFQSVSHTRRLEGSSALFSVLEIVVDFEFDLLLLWAKATAKTLNIRTTKNLIVCMIR